MVVVLWIVDFSVLKFDKCLIGFFIKIMIFVLCILWLESEWLMFLLLINC